MAEKRKSTTGRQGQKKRTSSKRRSKTRRKGKSKASWLIIVVLLVIYYVITNMKNGNILPAEGEIKVHYIDVGQGDCIFITDGNENMLIDCGESENTPRAVQYLNNLGVKKLDYVVGTHPHSDHMGGMAQIIETFDIGEFIIPHLDDSDIPTTVYFNKFLDAVEKYKVDLKEAKVGREINIGEAKCEIIAPNSEKYGDVNNYSVGIILYHGQNSFIFTGDAEALAEREMLDTGRLHKVNVYKAGHHGSSSSSSDAFLKVIDPDVAVISCGAGNKYGHPNESTIKRLESYTDQIYRTDLCGNIVISSDGEQLSVSTERNSR